MATADNGDDTSALAEKISELAGETGRTVATAESLTGGHISCQLGAAPNSSEWYRGSIVAYSSEVKHQLLEVPEGPVVSEPSARNMASTTARLLGADTVIAVTGAGGPDPQDGEDPGTVWFALFDRGRVTAEKVTFAGDPPEVVEQTARRALELLAESIAAQ
ncbi:CinA family protein [Rhodococcus sp. SGAir0479]|uniref:CinA family protein n=1 Tax=Rhodococcus sp. SGAir0479 TaxID=2567884 RepID=UPI0010CD24DF|nr:CinA family protein [Rhodococcus sp. SGAir0479]QCQ91361.1 CinA family protein [Rhodococcus sp. SGAir0479]